MAKTIQFYNEKGNVASKVREAVKKATHTKLGSVLTDGFGAGVVENANGGYSVPVAVDVGGNTIYAHLTFVITDADPSVKKEKKPSATKPKNTQPIVIDDLFD